MLNINFAMQEEKSHNVYLSLGTNLGEKEENILQALEYINERIGEVSSYSAFYITEPVGFVSENNFVNAVCIVSSHLSPLRLLDVTQQIEKEMGRTAKSENKVYTDRIIDIDILLYDDIIFRNERLTLPHPHLHERLFVLDPLAEIAGDYVHPILHKSIYELKEELK